MNRFGLYILALQSLQALGVQAASGVYKVEDCGANTQLVEKAIEASVEVAKTAVDVLKNNYNDGYVQSMLNDMFGTAAREEQVNKAKGSLETLAAIEQPGPFGFLPTNKDVLFRCTDAHYKVKTNEAGQSHTWHEPIGAPLGQEQLDIKNRCFGSANPDFNLIKALLLPMAQTFNSDLYNKKTEQSLPQETVPAQIDLCPWYLTFVQGATRQFTLIDKTLLDKVTAESFKLDAKDGSQTKVDVFSESLSGTILHELTHTNLGGRTIDDGQDCRGWGCIKNVKNGQNADSVNMLGVTMWLWKQGFYVDSSGDIHSRT